MRVRVTRRCVQTALIDLDDDVILDELMGVGEIDDMAEEMFYQDCPDEEETLDIGVEYLDPIPEHPDEDEDDEDWDGTPTITLHRELESSTEDTFECA